MFSREPCLRFSPTVLQYAAASPPFMIPRSLIETRNARSGRGSIQISLSVVYLLRVLFTGIPVPIKERKGSACPISLKHKRHLKSTVQEGLSCASSILALNALKLYPMLCSLPTVMHLREKSRAIPPKVRFGSTLKPYYGEEASRCWMDDCAIVASWPTWKLVGPFYIHNFLYLGITKFF